MGIDKSILTDVIYVMCTILCCRNTYKRTGNTLRTFFVFLWSISIYSVVTCCILPIQLIKSSDRHVDSIMDFCSRMTWEQFQKYFLEYFLRDTSFFTSFLCVAFVGCVLYSKLRKLRFSILLLVFMQIIHLVYNISHNMLVDDIIKFINAEDFLLMAMGFLLGWSCAKITLKLCPVFADKILIQSSEV